MSVVHLVRHGQASFGRADYDRLTELGETQSGLVGAWLAERGVRPAVLVSGSMQRQRVTASRLWEAAGWESAVDVDPGWNEYDHDAILRGYRPAYRNPAVLRADMARHLHPRRAFQEMFVEATARWASGEFDDDYAETFAHFRDRVALALGRVTSRLGKREDAVVVTSGGPMSWVAAALLTAPQRPSGPEASLPREAPDGSRAAWTNLSAVTVNTGITRVLVGRSLTVLSTNEHAHLTVRSELVTYR